MLSGILALVSIVAGGLVGFFMGWVFWRRETPVYGTTVSSPFFGRKVEKKKPKAFSEQELWEREQEVKERGSRLNG